MKLQWRPFRLVLPRPLVTAAGRIDAKRGWLLRLEGTDGAVGWGEAAPLDGEVGALERAIADLGPVVQRSELEQWLAAGRLPGSLAFALGAGLAELDGLPRRRWLPAPAPAHLLPAGPAALAALDALLATPPAAPLAVKWKVAVHSSGEERAVLEQLLQLLPVDARLRLDANGGWDRATAWQWAERLAAEPRLQWLEQPLPAHDVAGLAAIAARVPVALDESLQIHPASADAWPLWQVRRPSQEGDPRPLLAALEAGRPWLMLSTAFETGIGRRWLHHLAALQAEGATPAAPGLAPGWQAAGALISADPQAVWEAAG